MNFPTFTWPDWKSAPRGTRFRHNMTGRTGTLIGAARGGNNGAIVIWDERPFPVKSVDGEEGHVFFVGIARDATPIDPDTSVGPMDADEWAKRNKRAHSRVQVNAAKSKIRNRTWDPEKGRRA